MHTKHLLFDYPHRSFIKSVVLDSKIKKGKFKILLRESIAEPTNQEGGDVGKIQWSKNNFLKFDRVYMTQYGEIWHEGELFGDRPEQNQKCKLEIDRIQRMHNAANSASFRVHTLLCAQCRHECWPRLQLQITNGCEYPAAACPAWWRQCDSSIPSDMPCPSSSAHARCPAAKCRPS